MNYNIFNNKHRINPPYLLPPIGKKPPYGKPINQLKPPKNKFNKEDTKQQVLFDSDQNIDYYIISTLNLYKCIYIEILDIYDLKVVNN